MLNYSCAVVNAKIVGNGKLYFIPIRVCIGKFDKKNNVFHDYLANAIIPNLVDSAYLNFDNGFSHVTSLSSLLKFSKKLNLCEALQKFLAEKRKKVIVATFDTEKLLFTFKEFNAEDLRQEGIKVNFKNLDTKIKRIMD